MFLEKAESNSIQVEQFFVVEQTGTIQIFFLYDSVSAAIRPNVLFLDLPCQFSIKSIVVLIKEHALKVKQTGDLVNVIKPQVDPFQVLKVKLHVLVQVLRGGQWEVKVFELAPPTQCLG